MVKESLDASAKDIPTQFNSTFKGINFHDSRTLYRSVEWTEHFLYSVPALISPRLKDTDAAKNINKLVRASLLAMQWNISPSNLQEIEQ
jgi:hypothetical protein